MTDHIIVMVTVPSKLEAEKISAIILDEGLCACVNILPAVKSLFHWEGKIDNAEEILLVIKTKSTSFSELEKLIKKNHSYKVPEIIAIPIILGSKDYLDWIDSTVK
ncbi:MAG: divalent-cation tolerance protein CutA [bacterium]